MVMLNICKSPGCSNSVKRVASTNYCNECRKEHSSYVLDLQVEHGKPIKEIILDARIFQNAQCMADYIGISFVSLYGWIEKYFGMNFTEFKREYICRSRYCKNINLEGSSLKLDYAAQRLRSRMYCVCVNSKEPNKIMTNAPSKTISELFETSHTFKESEDGEMIADVQPVKFEPKKEQ